MNRVLIANRGEIACRIIRAAMAVGVETVAIYSEADVDLPHVTLADKAVLVGPANARQSYLDMDKLLSVAVETGCTMVHPGYGFMSENAEFARRVQAEGLAFVGPAPEHIELMGDKQNARAAAIEAGVPVLRPLVAEWLTQRADVLAFASAPPALGGTGALLVLLDRKRR